MVTVRAVYEGDGKLRLLEPLNLQKGEEVRLTLEPASEDVLRTILADLNIQWPDPLALVDDQVDEEALMHEIQEGFKGARSLSEIIIEERGEGL